MQHVPAGEEVEAAGMLRTAGAGGGKVVLVMFTHWGDLGSWELG